jgi:acetolactate synthase regulatory subunit
MCPTTLRVVLAGSGSEILSRITVLLTSRAVTTLSLCATCNPAAGVTLVHLVVECAPARTPLLCRQLERLVQVSSVEVLRTSYADDALDLALCRSYSPTEPV